MATSLLILIYIVSSVREDIRTNPALNLSPASPDDLQDQNWTRYFSN